jgi:hypothetical protein
MSIKELASWPNLLEHILELNRRGYADVYQPDLGVAISFGHMDENFRYVILSTTQDFELCAVALKTKGDCEKVLLSREEGGWRAESVWLKDQKLSITMHVTGL